MKVIIAYWLDEEGNPRSIERITTTAAQMRKWLRMCHPDTCIKWFEHPSGAAKNRPDHNEHWWKDGWQYLQNCLDEDNLGIIGAQIAPIGPDGKPFGKVWKYGFQVRNLH